ncbi:hypothetical protein [Cupriavidus pinatubonensis]|uniref:Uncharacterized protein n=1 Tax=Cupriavidus pinatubonensis TaxID=248026 RepID=A0ABN7YEY5_9BURK|nr:hypothetical protein [Cupriavidus pinatubonensis]CAG9170812.1 hypothetical protein LMG23994_02011 [Cupriavidus pinatubonensis]
MLKLKAICDADISGSAVPDLVICACGYEGRATAVAAKMHELGMNPASRQVAFGFGTQQVLKYSENKAWFEAHGFDVVETMDESFRQGVDAILRETSQHLDHVKIEIDVSCLNRFRLAHLIDAVRCMEVKSAAVNFHYCLAEYTPPIEDAAPIVTVEPVIPQFSGWTTRPDRPPAAIVGLGYETNKAIGVVDHLEINNATWAFYPVSPIPEYHDSLQQANESLLRLIQTDGRCRPYEVGQPAKLFQEVNSLVHMLRTNFNIVLIPFGPKLFALVVLLVGCMHDDVGVWRVSSDSLEQAVNRVSSGNFIGLHVDFLGETTDF